MTLGEKIKKYRVLRGKTQRQLGEEVGFSKSTADVRVNQYESNRMAPKADTRAMIAHVLDIDLEAISDINISSFEDIMFIFFELEELLGMQVEKRDGRTYLSFDDSDPGIATLISYLNLWYNKKNALITDATNVSDEQKRQYDLWKSRFSQNIKEYYSEKELEINDHYASLLSAIKPKYTYAKKTSEITLLLRNIIESGLYVSTRSLTLSNGVIAQGFTFLTRELLQPDTSKSEELFTQFLCEIDHFKSLGAACFTDLQMTGRSLTITYFIPVSSFSIISLQIKKLLEFRSNIDNQSDFTRDAFEKSFTSDLQTYYNKIEDEIELFCRK